MARQIEAGRSKPPIVKRAAAGLVLVVIAVLVLHFVIALVSAVFWIVLAVAVVFAALWAINTLF